VDFTLQVGVVGGRGREDQIEEVGEMEGSLSEVWG
jgi:hypothetical protein